MYGGKCLAFAKSSTASEGRKTRGEIDGALIGDRLNSVSMIALGLTQFRRVLTAPQNLTPREGLLSIGTKLDGAVEWSRTTDLLITNQLLYQLSYNSPG